jgi:hypothetical protein
MTNDGVRARILGVCSLATTPTPSVRGLVLAIEAVSPTTAYADRHKKRVIYTQEDVDEYWIVISMLGSLNDGGRATRDLRCSRTHWCGGLTPRWRLYRSTWRSTSPTCSI